MTELLPSPAVLTWVGAAWIVMLALNVLLHVAVYVNPHRLVPYNALPWAFRFEFNLDLDFQSVTYATVHEKRIARWSHLTMPLEQVAWVIVLLSIHPAALVVVLALVTCQALLLGERPLAIWLVAMWLVLSALGAACLQSFGSPALVASQILLLVGPVLRFVGHSFEPIPPFVAQQGDAFIPLSRMPIRPSIIFLALGGIVSEFAAALPHRLIVVQMFWVAQQFGYAPGKANAWPEARRLGAAIRANGWKAYEKTRRLLVPDAPPVADVPVPSVAVDA